MSNITNLGENDSIKTQKIILNEMNTLPKNRKIYHKKSLIFFLEKIIKN